MKGNFRGDTGLRNKGASEMAGSFGGKSLTERMTEGTEGGAMDAIKATLFGTPADLQE